MKGLKSLQRHDWGLSQIWNFSLSSGDSRKECISWDEAELKYIYNEFGIKGTVIKGMKLFKEQVSRHDVR